MEVRIRLFLAVHRVSTSCASNLAVKGCEKPRLVRPMSACASSICQAPHVRLIEASLLQQTTVRLLRDVTSAADRVHGRGHTVLVRLKRANHPTSPHGFDALFRIRNDVGLLVLRPPRISRTTGCDMRGGQCFRRASESSLAANNTQWKRVVQSVSVL